MRASLAFSLNFSRQAAKTPSILAQKGYASFESEFPSWDGHLNFSRQGAKTPSILAQKGCAPFESEFSSWEGHLNFSRQAAKTPRLLFQHSWRLGANNTNNNPVETHGRASLP